MGHSVTLTSKLSILLFTWISGHKWRPVQLSLFPWRDSTVTTCCRSGRDTTPYPGYLCWVKLFTYESQRWWSRVKFKFYWRTKKAKMESGLKPLTWHLHLCTTAPSCRTIPTDLFSILIVNALIILSVFRAYWWCFGCPFLCDLLLPVSILWTSWHRVKKINFSDVYFSLVYKISFYFKWFKVIRLRWGYSG